MSMFNEDLENRVFELERENSRLKAEVARLVTLTRGQKDTIWELEKEVADFEDQLKDRVTIHG